MNPEELAELGIAVHTIKGYGDTAVAECAVALMWAAARGLGTMHREIVAGGWPRPEGRQLTGRTVGLIGLGGIGAEMARLCAGAGMHVLAWNRTPKAAPPPGVTMVADPDTLLSGSDVVSLHLLLDDATRGFLSRERLGRMRPGAILVNTARGPVVDEAALLAALRSGRLAAAALDVFAQEPPAGSALPGSTCSPRSRCRRAIRSLCCRTWCWPAMPASARRRRRTT
jgi:D-3-phosphoglycerate dehydrogenase